MELNWTTIIVAFIGSIPATLFSIAILIQSRSTHKLVNSRMSEMLQLNRVAATAMATLAEKDAEQKRQKDNEDDRPAGNG